MHLIHVCLFVYCFFCSDTGEILNKLGAGDFFGEIGILNLAGGFNRLMALLALKFSFKDVTLVNLDKYIKFLTH